MYLQISNRIKQETEKNSLKISTPVRYWELILSLCYNFMAIRLYQLWIEVRKKLFYKNCVSCYLSAKTVWTNWLEKVQEQLRFSFQYGLESLNLRKTECFFGLLQFPPFQECSVLQCSTGKRSTFAENLGNFVWKLF